MANWIWSLGPWKPGASTVPSLANQSGPQANLGSVTTRNLKIKLLDPHEASFTVWGFSAEAALIEELITDLWVYRDGVPVFRGRVTGPLADTLDPHRYDLTVEARGYREVLNRRQLFADRTWTNIEQSQIVWDLITDTQAQTNGNLGLTQGTWPVTGIVRPSVTFKAGDSVGDSIKKLSQMNGGFDFDIDINLNAQLYYPSRGQDNGVVLDYGGAVQKANRVFDPAQYANAIRQSGASGVAAATAQVSDLAARPEGRWDAQYSDTQLNTADMVAQTAQRNLALAGMMLPSYALQLAKGAWQGPNHVWVGDYITVVLKAGRLNEIVKARVFELNIALDSSNNEDVTVVAGNPHLDPRSVLRGIGKRLNAMARN